jgi:hypothetical protein
MLFGTERPVGKQVVIPINKKSISRVVGIFCSWFRRTKRDRKGLNYRGM